MFSPSTFRIMGERPTLKCQQHCSAIVNNSNGRYVMVFVSPILVTLLCLIATGMNAKAQFLLKTDKGTDKHRDIETSPRFLVSQQQFVQKKQLSQGGTSSVSSFEQPLPPPPALSGVISYGNEISLNGRIFSGAWLQQREKTGSLSIHLSDAAVRQLFGVDFLDSSNPNKQPIQWFSSDTKPLVLSSVLTSGYRYLDVTNFAKTAQWQMQVVKNTLVVTTPSAKVTNISQDKQQWRDRVRIIVALDRPTLWQITQGLPIKKPQLQIEEEGNSSTQLSSSPPRSTSPPNREWIITLDGVANPVLAQRYTPSNTVGQVGQDKLTTPSSPALIQQVEVVNNQTMIHLGVPLGLTPRISTVANPNRLIIEIRPDAMVERNITWAPGLNWRQRFVNLGKERFPVVWLEINPRTSGIKLKPISTTPNSLIGTAPLIQTAQQYSAVAAINGGYF
ncbi:hypothetical protein HW132_24670 [Brasilonema sp. CT11]|nr:hypothetical protein [Brasilonema sp. CT11]